MKPTSQEKSISFRDTLAILGSWRRGSICVQLCFLGRPGSSENVRVSIDGFVKLVDSNGIVTVSGEDRKIDIDLRGSQITYTGSGAAEKGKSQSLVLDSMLEVKFPDGEICLISAYRQSGKPLPAQIRAENGRESNQNNLSMTAAEDHCTMKYADGRFKISSLANRNRMAGKPRMSKTGPPLLPMGAFLLLFMLITLTLTPSSVPKLLAQLGVRQKMRDPGAMVWVISQDGDYYCAGSTLNGQKPGKWMSQGQALTLGYQPAVGNYCAEGTDSNADSQGNGFLNYYRAVRQNGKALFLRLARISYSWLPQT